MIPIATPEVLERCVTAICGTGVDSGSIRGSAGSFAAAYRRLARRVPARPLKTRCNLAAIVHCARGDGDAAIGYLEQSLEIEFSQYPFQVLLADILVRAGRWEQYERKGEFGLEIVAALEGRVERPSRYHPALVGKLFDRLSIGYETRVANESYAEHTKLAALIAHVLPLGKPLELLDLGCGTGMLGEALVAAGVEATLTGVDASEAMLEQARTRGRYAALHLADIDDFLREIKTRSAFHVAALASVIPFFGDLDALFEALHAALAEGGWLAFTYDIAATADAVEFNAYGRFRHADAYVHEQLARAGFTVCAESAFAARMERGVPVAAQAIVARQQGI